jgi:hypothetical protein
VELTCVAQPGCGLAREELGEEEGEEQWPDHASREVFTCSNMLEFSCKNQNNSKLGRTFKGWTLPIANKTTKPFSCRWIWLHTSTLC